MVKELRIYFEGDPRLRPGFWQFLSEIAKAARSKRWHFDLIATEGTPAQDFQAALKAHRDAWNVLLLDGENPQEFRLRKKSLEGCDQDSVFWMVQIMESWFLADVGALKALYKERLNEAALRRNPKVEEIPRGDVLSSLENATRGTKAGKYQKNHAFKLLGLIDPAKVRKAAPHCEQMFNVILAKLS
jgi:Domain of unknown function (DUF4276)